MLKALVALAASASLLLAPPQLELRLPPGPAAALLAEPQNSDTRPDLPSQTVPAWSDRAWDTAQPWDAWSAALAEPGAPAARLHLMRVARALGRSEAAWEHFAALPTAWARAVRNELLAGPAEGFDGTLHFRPLLPPLPDYDHETWTELPPKRIYTAQGVMLGMTQVDLSVEDAPEGVEIHLTWKAGPALDLLVSFPMPPGRKARLVYVDWDSVELSTEGYRLHLAPPVEGEEPEHVLWARSEAGRRPWPQLGQAQFTANPTRLELLTTPDDPLLMRMQGFASLLAKSLGLEVVVRTVDPQTTTARMPSHHPLAVDLSPSAERMAKWLDLASQAERVAAAQALAPKPGNR